MPVVVLCAKMEQWMGTKCFLLSKITLIASLY